MKKTLSEAEITQLRIRLQSRLDYFIAILLWFLFIFSFFSIWAIGSLDPIHAGLMVAIQDSPIFLLFPAFATFGMISDRILVSDLLKYSVKNNPVQDIAKSNGFRLNHEDCIRIFLITLILFISLPWLAARLGIFLQPYDSTFNAQVLFFQPVHIGEHHGFVGIYMILAIILISKTEKLYLDSIFKEITIYGLCLALVWGIGLFINDFSQEQLNINFPFWVWNTDPSSFIWFAMQLCIIAGLSGIIYYLGWRKYFKKKQ